MLIQINRSIFLALNDELRKTYVYEAVQRETGEILDYEEEAMVTDAIVNIITRNEEFHKKYGVMRGNGLLQVDDTCMVPGESEPSGYYQLATLLVAPFDWSWDDNGDFDYSFELYRSIEKCIKS